MDLLYIHIILAENTDCEDAEYSTTNERYEYMWLNSEVYYSYDACNISKRDSKVFPSSLIIFMAF